MDIMFYIVELIMVCVAIGCALVFVRSALLNKNYRERPMRIAFGFINVIMCGVWSTDALMNGTKDFEIILITIVAMIYVDKLLSDKWLIKQD